MLLDVGAKGGGVRIYIDLLCCGLLQTQLTGTVCTEIGDLFF